MTTQERIQHLANFGQSPELLGTFDTETLSTWVEAELGHSEALDRFVPHGPILSQAYAPQTLLHIVSGNTPHGAIQSLLRGLIIGAHNIVKLPSMGLPEIENWIGQLPDKLRQMVEIRSNIDDDTWQQAQTIIAIGSDSTMAKLQQKVLPSQHFIPHGHKVSIGIVLSDLETAATLAAKDVSIFNQRGCLSPHAIYVQEQQSGDALKFAGLLAVAMADFAELHTPEPINLSEAGAIRNLRETTRFIAANSPDSQLFESSENLDWTVVYESSSELKLSCLNCCVYVKPAPKTFDLITLGKEAAHLSSVALHPFHPDGAAKYSHLPANRFCPLGQSQEPSLFWHHDGLAPLASLVTWKDIG